MIKCGMVNCYIIQQEEFSILIDTGTKVYRSSVLDRAKQLDVKYIILTHGHSDHIENTKFLADNLNAKIILHKNDYELSKNNCINEIYSKTSLGNILKIFSKINFKMNKIEDFEPDILLDKDEFSLTDNIKIILLQGHTKGSVGVLINDAELICGDTFMNFRNPSSALIAEDFENLKESIEFIKKSNIKNIYPGHGEPFTTEDIQ